MPATGTAQRAIRTRRYYRPQAQKNATGFGGRPRSNQARAGQNPPSICQRPVGLSLRTARFHFFVSPSGVKNKATRTACLNNAGQINLGIHMYCDDSNDVSPNTEKPSERMASLAYKELMKSYVGLKGRSSAQDRIFACPADTFYYDQMKDSRGFYNIWTNVPHGQHEQPRYDYSSYWFNGFNFHANDNPELASWLGIAGRKIASIKDPAKTVLIAEAPAFYPYSWHHPRPGEGPMFNDANDVVGFVDGHVSYIRIYWPEVPGNLFACFSDPPARYDYKWSGD